MLLAALHLEQTRSIVYSGLLKGRVRNGNFKGVIRSGKRLNIIFFSCQSNLIEKR